MDIELYTDQIEDLEKIKSIVKEETVKYIRQAVVKQHDKSIRNVLSNKEEAATFINDVLKLKHKLTKNDLEEWSTRYITDEFEDRETDIVYKVTNNEKAQGNVFIMIEHQTKIDYAMPYRIFEYESLIARKCIEREKLHNKSYKLPLFIPIVIYTGEKEWNAEEQIEKQQSKLIGYEGGGFGNYILVQVKKNTKEEMLKKSGILYKIILLESTKKPEEAVKLYNEIIKEKMNQEQKRILLIYMKNILIQTVGRAQVEKWIEEEKIESGGNSMLAEVLRKYLDDEIKKGVECGIREATKELKEKARQESEKAKKEFAKAKIEAEKNRKEAEEEAKRETMEAIATSLLNMKMPISKIAEATGLTPKQIENL